MKRLLKKAIYFSEQLDTNQQQVVMDSVKNSFLSGQLNARGVTASSGNDIVECLMNVHLPFSISIWDFNAALSQLFYNDTEIQNKIKETYSQTVLSVSDQELSFLNLSKEEYTQLFNDSLDSRVKMTRGSILNKEPTIKDFDNLVVELYIPSAMSS